jgi:endonuclease/exonuclease/phosphatase (EEP) superfamily protein YafD
VQLTRGGVARVLVVVLPWTWFWARDASAAMEVVAALLPALVALVVALWLALGDRNHWLRLAALSWTVFGVVVVVGPWQPRDTGHPREDANVVLAVAHTGAHDRRVRDAVDDIVGQHADVVVVTDATNELHGELVRTFRYSLRADEQAGTAVGVYSNPPIEAPLAVDTVLDDHHALRVVVGGKLVLWALQQPSDWRTPSRTTQTVDALLGELSHETLPVVVAGDTTITDRGRAYRRLVDHYDDAMRAAWGGPTARAWYLRPLLLRVDHVFEPTDWCADRAGRFPIAGSDRRGVHVRVGPCA